MDGIQEKATVPTQAHQYCCLSFIDLLCQTSRVVASGKGEKRLSACWQRGHDGAHLPPGNFVSINLNRHPAHINRRCPTATEVTELGASRIAPACHHRLTR